MLAAVGICFTFMKVAVFGTMTESSVSSVSISGVIIVSPNFIFSAKLSRGTSSNSPICCNDSFSVSNIANQSRLRRASPTARMREGAVC